MLKMLNALPLELGMMDYYFLKNITYKQVVSGEFKLELLKFHSILDYS